MSIDQLVTEYNRRVETFEKYPELLKIDFERRLQLTMKRPKSWKKVLPAFPERVRTPFGMCKCWPAAEGDILVFPTMEQVKNFLAKHFDVKELK